MFKFNGIPKWLKIIFYVLASVWIFVYYFLFLSCLNFFIRGSISFRIHIGIVTPTLMIFAICKIRNKNITNLKRDLFLLVFAFVVLSSPILYFEVVSLLY
jgi:hypothetical protein